MVSVFTWGPVLEYGDDDELPVIVLKYAGRGTEQRAKLHAIERRVFDWSVRATDSEKTAIKTFLRTANQMVTSFYVRDPKDNTRTGVSLGTSVSGQTSFPLPSSGENFRDYPISTATFTIYDDGGATGTTVTVRTDARVVSLSTAPTSGSVMTADYHYYRLVRLDRPQRWRRLAPNFSEGSLAFREVPA